MGYVQYIYISVIIDLHTVIICTMIQNATNAIAPLIFQTILYKKREKSDAI